MISIRKYIGEYRNSLKHPEAEEIVDLLFFRPVSFFLVKLIYRLPVTPNQISLLSLAAGLASAYFLSFGEIEYYRTGALLLSGANLLDCMDGQLARLQGSGTFLGRVVDGVADYITGIAVFIALALGLERANDSIWLFIAVAGISTILQAMAFDHYQGEFIKARTGKGNITANDVKERYDKKDSGSGKEHAAGPAILSSLYLFYLKLQEKSRIIFPNARFHFEIPSGGSLSMIRFWSFLGPSTNRSIIIIFCLIGIPFYYLFVVFIGGNIWLAVCLVCQHRLSVRGKMMVK